MDTYQPENSQENSKKSIKKINHSEKTNSPLIMKKAGNKVVSTTEKQTELPSNVTDLMSALQASLDKTKKKKPAPRKRTPKAKTS